MTEILHDDTEDMIPLAKCWENGGTVENPKALLRGMIGEIERLRAEVKQLARGELDALTERDERQETIDRILYTCSSEEDIGEWSSSNDPVERFIELFRPVERPVR